MIKKSGFLKGILNAKGDAWVEVKEDKGLLERYLAPWLGGSPSRGGGFDSKTLGVFKDLVVGNRVYLDWFWDGHLRVRTIKSIKPFKRSGIMNGILIQKGDRWIDVESKDSFLPWRFYANWVGGMPEVGGTYNPKTLEFFKKFEVNESVRVVWSYDHRPRIERFIEQEKEEVFVPFYEGKNIPVGVINSQPSPPVVNPFEQVSTPKQVNPFDQAVPAPQANPFDQVPNAIPLNPFDTLISPTKGSVDQGGDEQNSESPESNNPFENVPVPTAQESNPFENVPLPGNPFDTLPKN